MSSISAPSMQASLLLGQNGAQRMAGQIDEVCHCFNKDTFCFVITKFLTFNFSINL